MSFCQRFLVGDIDNAPNLLTLPYEIREKILQFALRQPGSVELQHPVWAGIETYDQPLFRVSRRLRAEAVDIFYQVNQFLWIIDSDDDIRSDPARYPSRKMISHEGVVIKSSISPLLTPRLPWESSELLNRIRRLQINVYLPQGPDAKTLQQQLAGLVAAVDKGRRLAECHVLITATRRAAQTPLTTGERNALNELTNMEVRGRVQIQTRHYFRAVSASVNSMDLARRMRA